MRETERMVREIFLVHGETEKFPLEEAYAGKDEDGEPIFVDMYDYEEDYMIEKRLTHVELKKHIMKRGYTEEQAEKIILKCCVRGTIGCVIMNQKRENDIYALVNEEHWVEDEHSSLRHLVINIYGNSEVKDYVLKDAFNWNDTDEKKIREVFHEHNTKHLTRQQLTQGLVKRGYTPQEAQKLIEKYTTKEEEKPPGSWWPDLDERQVKKPEYKPLRHHEERIIFHSEYDYTTIPDCLEIMQPEEWLLPEYADLIELRYDRWCIHGTQNIPFRKIREILRRNEEQQGRSTPHSELKRELMRACGASEEEAEMAIYAALRTFKIREKIPREDPRKEPEYYWSGTTGMYPPLTLQDRVFNPIKEIFGEAEKHGKTTLTREELVQKALEAYKKYEKHSLTHAKKPIDREYTETLIQEAEELLLIKPVQGGYQLNKQVLENLNKTKNKQNRKEH